MKKKTAVALRDIFTEIDEMYPKKSFEWQLQMAADTANQRNGWSFEPYQIVEALAMCAEETAVSPQSTG